MQKYQSSWSESTTKEIPTLETWITSESDETDTGMTTFSSTLQEEPQTSMEGGITKTTLKIKSVPQTDGKNIRYCTYRGSENAIDISIH